MDGETGALVTVCIAASCAGGTAVVVASDRMLSAPFLTVEFDHQDAKIDQIGANCVALSSGDALCVQDILIGGLGAAHQLQNPPIATLAEQIKIEFCSVRKNRVNDLILGIYIPDLAHGIKHLARSRAICELHCGFPEMAARHLRRSGGRIDNPGERPTAF